MKDKLYIVLMLSFFYLQGCTSENSLPRNENAAVNLFEDLPENLFLLDIITMSIHPKDSVATVLYGNEIAFNYVKNDKKGKYPIGSILYDVTWKLKEDENWFGATIPDRVSKIERIEITANDKTDYHSFNYEACQPLHTSEIQQRITHIKAKKMAIHP